MPYEIEKEGFRSTQNKDLVRVLRATNVGSAAWDEKQAASRPEYEHTHTDSPDPESRLMMDGWNLFLLASISRLLPHRKEIRTLDVGCGIFHDTPSYAKGLPDLGIYVGLDPLVDSTTRAYPFINARFEDLPQFFDHPLFDVFAFSSVLDHFETIEPVIEVTRTFANPGAVACFFIGVHEPAVLAEHYGRFLGKRVYASLSLFSFLKQYLFSIASMPAYYSSLVSRSKATQAGRPLDALHFRYYTEQSLKTEVQRFGDIKQFYRFPGTNWCFVSCVLS